MKLVFKVSKHFQSRRHKTDTLLSFVGSIRKYFHLLLRKWILTNFQPQLNKSKTFSEKIKYVSIATSKPLKNFPQGRVVFIAWGGEGFFWAEEYHGSQKEREGRSVVANRKDYRKLTANEMPMRGGRDNRNFTEPYRGSR